MGPETSMAVQAALNSDIALVFDECLPFHVTREYTAAQHGAHPPLARPLPGLARAARAAPARASTGSSRAGWRRTCAAGAPRRSPTATRSASRSAARSASTRSRCTRSSAGRRRSCRRSAPATCWASATSTTSSAATELGIDTFDCAMPTRIGRHGMAIVPDPGAPLARRPRQGPLPRVRRSDLRGLPLRGLRRRLLARLPALPVQDPRDDRPADRHAAQPRLPAAADGRPARRDRRGSPGRGRRRRARRRGAVGDVVSAARAGAPARPARRRSPSTSAGPSTAPIQCGVQVENSAASPGSSTSSSSPSTSRIRPDST